MSRCVNMERKVYCVMIIMVILEQGSAQGADKYDRFQVIRVFPQTEEHLSVLKRFKVDYGDGQFELLDMPSPLTGKPMDIVVSPGMMENLIFYIESFHVPYQHLVPDLKDAIHKHMRDNVDTEMGKFTLDRYHTYEEINMWLDDMANRHPDILTKFEIATSFEGRPIYAVKIGQSSSDESNRKPMIWLDAGIHANEWVGPATLLYFINEISEKKHSSMFKTILQHFELVLLPIFNVDGYVYTWTHDRLWRKTRSVYNSTPPSCAGVDMNRNWDIKWHEHIGANMDPCSRTYRGPRAFSEPEIQAVSGFLQENKAHLKAYIAYHSYSQYWMMPYAYSAEQQPSNYAALSNLSQVAVEAIEKVHGTKYLWGSVSNLIGVTAGSSVDFTYDALNVRYSFGVELRDNGVYGNLLPANQIIPNAEESLAAIISIADWLIQYDNN